MAKDKITFRYLQRYNTKEFSADAERTYYKRANSIPYDVFKGQPHELRANICGYSGAITSISECCGARWGDLNDTQQYTGSLENTTSKTHYYRVINKGILAYHTPVKEVVDMLEGEITKEVDIDGSPLYLRLLLQGAQFPQYHENMVRTTGCSKEVIESRLDGPIVYSVHFELVKSTNQAFEDSAIWNYGSLNNYSKACGYDVTQDRNRFAVLFSSFKGQRGHLFFIIASKQMPEWREHVSKYNLDKYTVFAQENIINLNYGKDVNPRLNMFILKMDDTFINDMKGFL